MDIVFVTAGSVGAHEDFASGTLSGTESQIRGVARELVSRGHSVQVVRRGDSDSVRELPSGIELVDLRVPALGAGTVSQLPTKLLFSFRARRHVRSEAPDAVAVTMKYVTAFTVTVPQPVVHFAFNNPADITPGKGAVARVATGYFDRRIAASADGLVVRNQAVERWADARADGVVRRINCGIDVDKYEPSETGEYVLFGGRLSSEKNVDLLVRAYARLDDAIRERWPLRIVGEGPLEEDLRGTASSLGVAADVEFEPWLPTDQFRSRVRNAACIAIPSTFEGMPVVAVEAMGCGKPVVGSDIPGIAAVVEDGETGLLFDAGDADALSRALERLLTDETERWQFGAAGRRTVERDHSFASVADEYLDLFTEVSQE